MDTQVNLIDTQHLRLLCHPLRPRLRRYEKEKHEKEQNVELLVRQRTQLFFLNEISRGGWFGPVLQAEATQTNGRKEPVVVRMLNAELGKSASFQKCFELEGQAFRYVSEMEFKKILCTKICVFVQ